MGHYAGEMGRVDRDAKPDNSGSMWLVDGRDLSVMQVSEFDRKYKYTVADNGMMFPGNPVGIRFGAKLWATREEAMDHRFAVADGQISGAKQDLHYRYVRLQELLMKREALG